MNQIIECNTVILHYIKMDSKVLDGWFMLFTIFSLSLTISLSLGDNNDRDCSRIIGVLCVLAYLVSATQGFDGYIILFNIIYNCTIALLCIYNGMQHNPSQVVSSVDDSVSEQTVDDSVSEQTVDDSTAVLPFNDSISDTSTISTIYLVDDTIAPPPISIEVPIDNTDTITPTPANPSTLNFNILYKVGYIIVVISIVMYFYTYIQKSQELKEEIKIRNRNFKSMN